MFKPRQISMHGASDEVWGLHLQQMFAGPLARYFNAIDAESTSVTRCISFLPPGRYSIGGGAGGGWVGGWV
jgi:hypothetical protein